MAGFRYEALDAHGRLKRGVLESDSPRQARAQLREQQLNPLHVEALGQAGAKAGSGAAGGARLPLRGGIGRATLALLTRQFATLLGAGLTIEQTLNALVEQAESDAVRRVLAAVRGEVLAGHPLAQALAAHPRDFPELYRTLVAAGEASGQLPQVMLRLADYTEDRQALRSKVALAFVYPAIVTLVAILVVTGLLTWVVPQVVQVFRNTHQQLPLLTRLLIAASDFLRGWGWLLVVLLVVAIVVFLRALRDEDFRLRWHALLLRIPVAGRLIRGLNTARLASTLAILVSSRVPLLTALSAGVGVVGNLPMRRALVEAERQVREGATLSRALAASRMFPPVMVHLIAGGESSGTLDSMLERVATVQTQEVENRVAILTSLLEPLLILAMGAVVLLIVLAILLPIFDLNQIVK
ncbi:MAG: type II secretion system inner membrane protein GspF [Pseudomonadota bacterium]|nr:type II secretion system inner membrane protein GspF [Pseudomonadota bacterium]